MKIKKGTRLVVLLLAALIAVSCFVITANAYYDGSGDYVSSGGTTASGGYGVTINLSSGLLGFRLTPYSRTSRTSTVGTCSSSYHSIDVFYDKTSLSGIHRLHSPTGSSSLQTYEYRDTSSSFYSELPAASETIAEDMKSWLTTNYASILDLCNAGDLDGSHYLIKVEPIFRNTQAFERQGETIAELMVDQINYYKALDSGNTTGEITVTGDGTFAYGASYIDVIWPALTYCTKSYTLDGTTYEAVDPDNDISERTYTRSNGTKGSYTGLHLDGYTSSYKNAAYNIATRVQAHAAGFVIYGDDDVDPDSTTGDVIVYIKKISAAWNDYPTTNKIYLYKNGTRYYELDRTSGVNTFTGSDITPGTYDVYVSEDGGNAFSSTETIEVVANTTSTATVTYVNFATFLFLDGSNWSTYLSDTGCAEGIPFRYHNKVAYITNSNSFLIIKGTTVQYDIPLVPGTPTAGTTVQTATVTNGGQVRAYFYTFNIQYKKNNSNWGSSSVPASVVVGSYKEQNADTGVITTYYQPLAVIGNTAANLGISVSDGIRTVSSASSTGLAKVYVYKGLYETGFDTIGVEACTYNASNKVWEHGSNYYYETMASASTWFKSSLTAATTLDVHYYVQTASMGTGIDSITASVNNENVGAVASGSSVTVLKGSVVSLCASPQSGYVFSYWDTSSNTTNPLSYTVSAAASHTAYGKTSSYGTVGIYVYVDGRPWSSTDGSLDSYVMVQDSTGQYTLSGVRMSQPQTYIKQNTLISKAAKVNAFFCCLKLCTATREMCTPYRPYTSQSNAIATAKHS